MQIFAYGQTFNPSQIFVDDVYIEVIPPTGYYGGVNATISATWGTASWGQLNFPQLSSAPNSLLANYGGVTNAALTDPFDLCTDVVRALNQAQGTQGAFNYATRVAHGSSDYTLSGTLTQGDYINLVFSSPIFTVTGSNPVFGVHTFQYHVASGDTTLLLLAQHIATALTADTTLTNLGFTITATGATFSIAWPYQNGTGSITASVNGITTATIGGTITATDTVAIVFNNAALPGGTHTVTYTVQNADTTTTIATALKTAINADMVLSTAGISSTSAAAVLTLSSTSYYQTTYTSLLSTNATETVTFTGGPTEILTATGAPASQAFVQLFDISSTPQLGGTLYAIWTGSKGAQLSIQFIPGNMPNSITVHVIPFAGAGLPETYLNLPSSGALFWNALYQALNHGLYTASGPSQFLRFLNPQVTSMVPNMQSGKQIFLVGGNDGRLGITSADLLGSNTGPTPTGIYAIETAQFTPSVAWIAGLSDTTIYSTIQAFARQNNIQFWTTLPTGLSTAAAVTAKSNLGILDPNMVVMKDYVLWYDQANNITRFVSPMATGAGLTATLPPWQSPENITMSDLVGTERYNSPNGTQPYLNSDLAQFGQAGITLITNFIPAGGFGLRNGLCSVGGNGPTSGIEYGRMTNYLAESIGGLLGPFIGKLQGFSNNDPLRSTVAATVNSFLGDLLTPNYIAGFSVVCNMTNNTQSTISQFTLVCQVYVTYMATVRKILVPFQGGVTVQTVSNPLGPTTLPLSVAA